ncbi:MAG: phage major capsid protein, partial [Bacteroidota bacterium]
VVVTSGITGTSTSIAVIFSGTAGASASTVVVTSGTTRASISTVVVTSSFGTIDADDWHAGLYELSPAARSGAVFAIHPDMLEHLYNLQDGQGAYIYGKPSEINPNGTLWGKSIEMSEACPITDGASKTYGFVFNPRYVAYADGRSMTADLLTEGSVLDEGGSTVNLASTDQKALRLTNLFDIQLSNVTRSTDGTARGAFTRLRTAAS